MLMFPRSPWAALFAALAVLASCSSGPAPGGGKPPPPAAAPLPDDPPPSAETASPIAVVGAESSCLFARRGDDVRNLLRVTVDNKAEKTAATARVRAAGMVVETPLPKLASGRGVYEVDAPAVDGPTPAVLEIVAGVGGASGVGGGSSPRWPAHRELPLAPTLEPAPIGVSLTLQPRRRWTLFLDPSVHTDIGFTDTQENVFRLHNENLDKAIRACENLPSFQWDLENSWQLEHYEASRAPEQTQKLVDLVKAGRIGVSALYLNILTGACSSEGLNRAALGAAGLRRRFGISTPQALLTDVPTSVGTLPMVLANSGVRYFAEGVNPTRAPYYADPQAPPLPFWWEGPDGSRVLTWLSPTGYANAEHYGLTRSVETAVGRLAPRLERFEQANYPYDAILLYGGVNDNQPLNAAYARVIDAWNRRYAYPRVVLAAQGQFFEHMEQTYGDRIPVLRGDNGCYWEDGAASAARETALNRRAQEDIVAAEKLMAINSLLGDARPYPQAEFARQWSNIFFYVEHTWGANTSVREPDGEFARRQWLVKANFAKEPATVLGPMVKDGLEWIGRRVRTGDAPAALVMNPLSWDRTDVVRVDLPQHLQGKSWVATRARTGEALPTQRVDERTLAFTSTAETGGIGYETYPLKEVGGTSGPDAGVGGSESSRSTASGGRELPLAPTDRAVARSDERSIENRFYKVTIDPRTGGIASITDRELDRELIDPESPYKANEYLYVTGGENSRLHEPSAAFPMPALKILRPEIVDVRPGPDGPVYGSLVVRTRNRLTPKITTEIILYRDVKRIDIVNRLTKQETYEKEAVYFPFPFNVRNPDIRLEVPDGVVRPEADQFGGACRDWYAAQHWVEVCEGGAGLVPARTAGGSGRPQGSPLPQTREARVGASESSRSPRRLADRELPLPPTRALRVTLSAPDTLLVCVNDIFRGKWMKKGELKIENGTLYAWAMNNYWYTNYKAGQGGDFEFRFSITSAAGGPDDVAASRFGWGVANPLLAAVLPSRQQGALPAELAFVTVDRPNAAVTAFKRAEAADGWVVRLLDVGGDGGPARVRFPAFEFREAALTNLVEEPIRPLAIQDHTVEVPLPKRGLATMLLR